MRKTRGMVEFIRGALRGSLVFWRLEARIQINGVGKMRDEGEICVKRKDFFGFSFTYSWTLILNVFASKVVHRYAESGYVRDI